MEDVVAFIETLEKGDLLKLESVILKQLKGKPMSTAADPLFDNKLQMFDEGVGGELPSSVDIYPDEVHSFSLKWNNGDITDVKVANQEGLMHACTTKYKVEYFKIGDLEVTASFPKGDRLPAGIEGIEDFVEELKKHDVSSKDDIERFVLWVLDTMENSCRTLTTTYARYLVQDSLFADYYPVVDENEEEGK